MAPIELEMTCSICGHKRFYIPSAASPSIRVTCANCSAYQCRTQDLEKVLLSLSRPGSPLSSVA